MSMHKFESQTEILTLDEGIYGKAAHIYIYKWLMCYKDMEYHIYPQKYVCSTY